MKLTRLPRPLALLASAAGVLLLVGCGSSTPTVAKADVEKEVSSELEKQVGQAPDKVECPDDLTGKVGTTERCSLTAGSDTYGLTVKVTSVQDKNVKFDIQVDDQPKGG